MLIAPRIEDGLLWSSGFVATFVVDTFDEFLNWIEDGKAMGNRLLAALSDDEDVTLVPVVNGHAQWTAAIQCDLICPGC